MPLMPWWSRSRASGWGRRAGRGATTRCGAHQRCCFHLGMALLLQLMPMQYSCYVHYEYTT